MVEIVGVSKKQLTSRPYKYRNGNQELQNDFWCLSIPATSNFHIKVANGFNPHVQSGLLSEDGPNHRCFALWADEEQQEALDMRNLPVVFTLLSAIDNTVSIEKLVAEIQKGGKNQSLEF